VPPELGCCPGGATPPLFGSTPPPLLPLPPPDGVPVPGDCEEAGGVLVPLEGAPVPPLDGVPELGVPPPEPPIGVPPEPFWLFLFFFLSPGCTGWPLVTGGSTGWTVCVVPDPLPPPPPLEAIAITTIRKNAAAASAANLRRR
jgi:hypothetical protein